MKHLIIVAAFAAGSMGAAFADDPDRQSADPDRQSTEEAAIRNAVEAYVAAYNAGDAEALAAMWSEEAVYTNPVTGAEVSGRAAIAEQFTSIFADAEDARLEATTNSIQFISPGVALEHGTARVIRPEQPAEESEYSAVYVKHDGKWLLDRVTEEDVAVVPSQYEHLKELEWLIGSWLDQDDQNRIETTYQWAKNHNFITSFFTVSVRDRVEMSGMQIIGWDPAGEHIRSWIFDSHGGFGEGVWSRKDNRWQIQATGTLVDGSSSSAVNIITQVDDDTLTWQSVNRIAAGEILPNVNEVVVVRQAAE